MEDARKGVFGRVTTGARPKPAPNTQTTSILTNQRRCGRRRTLRTRQPNHQHQPSSEQRSPDRRGVGNEDQERVPTDLLTNTTTRGHNTKCATLRGGGRQGRLTAMLRSKRGSGEGFTSDLCAGAREQAKRD